MTSLVLFLLAKDQSADAILGRFVPAMASIGSYETKFVLHAGQGEVNADLIMDGHKRLLYKAVTNRGEAFTVTDSPSGYRELELKSKIYDEMPYPGFAQVFPSRITGLAASFPPFLRTSDLHQMIAKGATIKTDGTDFINGNSCDKVHLDASGPMGKIAMDFSIAKSGLVYAYHVLTTSPMGNSDKTWTMTWYKPLKSIAQAEFEVPIPDGFMPFSLPDRGSPAMIGKKPDLRGWVDSRSGKPWGPTVGKPVLFLLTESDSFPCKHAMQALDRWGAWLREKGVSVAVGTDARSKEEAHGLLYNPDQRSVEKLGAPATPMFFLLDSTGTLQNLWMGFIPNEEDKLRGELLKAIASLKP